MFGPMSPRSQAPQTFPLFAKLPPELRAKIWAYNVPAPRVVSVRCGARSPPSSPARTPTATPLSRPSSSPLAWCTSPAAIPANLHACRESRSEALRHYALMFGIARQPGHVFFDASRDVLYFGPRDGYMASEAQLRTLLALADGAELARVQRLALNEAMWAAVASASSQMATNLTVDVLHLLRTRLPGLRELILVPRDDNPVYSADAVLVPLGVDDGGGGDGDDGNIGDDDEDDEDDDDDGDDNDDRYDRYDSHAAATARLGRQIQTAMRRVCSAAPEWTPPRWKIQALSSSTSSSPPSCRPFRARASLPSKAASFPYAAPVPGRAGAAKTRKRVHRLGAFQGSAMLRFRE